MNIAANTPEPSAVAIPLRWYRKPTPERRQTCMCIDVMCRKEQHAKNGGRTRWKAMNRCTEDGDKYIWLFGTVADGKSLWNMQNTPIAMQAGNRWLTRDKNRSQKCSRETSFGCNATNVIKRYLQSQLLSVCFYANLEHFLTPSEAVVKERMKCSRKSHSRKDMSLWISQKILPYK